MTTFDKRGQAFESKYALDEELKFKAVARRNKLLGLWAAEKLGKTGANADDYAKEVVLADFEEAGDEDIMRKLEQDFRIAGKTLDQDEVRRQLDTLMGQAVEQIKKAG